MSSFAHPCPHKELGPTGQLWDSLEDDDVSLTPAQRAELDRRLAALDEGGEAGISWEAFREPLQQRPR